MEPIRRSARIAAKKLADAEKILKKKESTNGTTHRGKSARNKNNSQQNNLPKSTEGEQKHVKIYKQTVKKRVSWKCDVVNGSDTKLKLRSKTKLIFRRDRIRNVCEIPEQSHPDEGANLRRSGRKRQPPSRLLDIIMEDIMREEFYQENKRNRGRPKIYEEPLIENDTVEEEPPVKKTGRPITIQNSEEENAPINTQNTSGKVKKPSKLQDFIKENIPQIDCNNYATPGPSVIMFQQPGAEEIVEGPYLSPFYGFSDLFFDEGMAKENCSGSSSNRGDVIINGREEVTSSGYNLETCTLKLRNQERSNNYSINDKMSKENCSGSSSNRGDVIINEREEVTSSGYKLEKRTLKLRNQERRNNFSINDKEPVARHASSPTAIKEVLEYTNVQKKLKIQSTSGMGEGIITGPIKSKTGENQIVMSTITPFHSFNNYEPVSDSQYTQRSTVIVKAATCIEKVERTTIISESESSDDEVDYYDHNEAEAFDAIYESDNDRDELDGNLYKDLSDDDHHKDGLNDDLFVDEPDYELYKDDEENLSSNVGKHEKGTSNSTETLGQSRKSVIVPKMTTASHSYFQSDFVPLSYSDEPLTSANANFPTSSGIVDCPTYSGIPEGPIYSDISDCSNSSDFMDYPVISNKSKRIDETIETYQTDYEEVTIIDLEDPNWKKKWPVDLPLPFLIQIKQEKEDPPEPTEVDEESSYDTAYNHQNLSSVRFNIKPSSMPIKKRPIPDMDFL